MMDITKIIKSKKLRFRILDLFSWIPDEPWLKLLFRIKNGYWMDFKSPKTFNEKIQWLKVYGYKPEYTQMVDKYEVKKYVADKIGKQYVIPTLGLWNRPEEIDWDILPNKFVLKTTHGGGSCGVVICKDKSSLDINQAIKELNISMSFTAGNSYREHPYMGVKKRVIAEKFLEENGKDDLWDYKFYCFNGEPKYCQVIRNRSSEETIDFYDMGWKHQESVGLNTIANNGATPVPRPSNLEDMKAVCRALAKEMPFVRIDLYEVGKREYFGEITFYPAGGFGEFAPKEWNTKLGDMINLNGTSIEGYKCMVNDDKVDIFRSSKDIDDYKFFCFDGKVKFFKVDFDRFDEHRANYYTPDCHLMPFGEVVCPPKPEAAVYIPNNIQEMINVAEQLSKGIPFLRVDLYNINGHIYFGELTFYPASGLAKWTDCKWDEEIGSMLKIK